MSTAQFFEDTSKLGPRLKDAELFWASFKEFPWGKRDELTQGRSETEAVSGW